MPEYVIQFLIAFFLLGIIWIPLYYLHKIWWSKWGWKSWGLPPLDINFDDYKEKELGDIELPDDHKEL